MVGPDSGQEASRSLGWRSVQVVLMRRLVPSSPSVPPREVRKSNTLWDRVLWRICLLNSRWDTIPHNCHRDCTHGQDQTPPVAQNPRKSGQTGEARTSRLLGLAYVLLGVEEVAGIGGSVHLHLLHGLTLTTQSSGGRRSQPLDPTKDTLRRTPLVSVRISRDCSQRVNHSLDESFGSTGCHSARACFGVFVRGVQAFTLQVSRGR